MKKNLFGSSRLSLRSSVCVAALLTCSLTTTVVADPRSTTETILDYSHSDVILRLSEALQEDEWAVVIAAGDIASKAEAESWELLREGLAVRPSTEIRSGSNGWAVLARGQDTIVVAADTEMALPRASDPAVRQIVQTKGTLLFRIAPRADRVIEIETPYLKGAVDNASFGVTVGKETATVTVSQGTVVIMSPTSGMSTDVAAGQTATMDPSDPSRHFLHEHRCGGHGCGFSRYVDGAGRDRRDSARECAAGSH